MIVLDTDYVRATYEINEHCILFAYKKQLKSEEFRFAWNKASGAAIEKKTHKYIIDSREPCIVSPEDQEWFVSEIRAKIRKALRKDTVVAIVLEDSIFTELTYQSMVDKIDNIATQDQTTILKYFKDLDEAKAWVKSVGN